MFATVSSTSEAPRRWLPRQRRWIVVALIAFEGMALGVRYAVTHSFIAGDSAVYFAMTRSLYADRDLDLANEMHVLRAERSPLTGNPKVGGEGVPEAATGRVAGNHPIGTSLILLPSYAAADLLTRTLAAMGARVDRTGYRGLYLIVPAFWSAAVAAIGLVLLARSLEPFLGAGAVFESVMLIWAATPLIYYMSVEPLMSHAAATGIASALVALAVRPTERSSGWRDAAIGALLGLLAITRYQDACYAAVVVLAIARARRGFLPAAAAALPFVVVQLSINVWWYGSPFETGSWPAALPMRIGWGALFNPLHGAFATHPIELLAIAGLLFSPDRRMAAALAIVCAAELLMTSAALPDGPAMSFGNRTVTSLAPIFVIGWASLTRRLPRLRWIGAALAAANLVLIAVYCARILR